MNCLNSLMSQIKNIKILSKKKKEKKHEIIINKILKNIDFANFEE
jgi:hypothetical protein